MTIAQIIELHIPLLKGGPSLYHCVSNYRIDQGDESSIEVLVYTKEYAELHNEDEDEMDHQDEVFCTVATENIKDYVEQKLLNTEKGDSITINLADRTIYFIIYRSGQY